MTPSDIVEAIVAALKESDDIPSNTKYVGYEPDVDKEPIKLPMIEVAPVSKARIDEHNTDKQGQLLDEDGNEIAEVYHSLYSLTLDVNMWTAQGSKYDYRVLGNAIYQQLYQYDSAGPGRSLADDVWRVRVGDARPEDDFTTSPTLRRWSLVVDVWAYEEFVEDKDYIVDVVVGGA